MPPRPVQSDLAEFCETKPLAEKDIVDLQRWIQAGMPKGDGPEPRPTLKPIGWRHGAPTRTLVVGKGGSARAEGPRYWQVFTIDVPKDITNLRSFDVLPEKPYSLQSVAIAIASPDAKTAAMPYETSGSLDASGPRWIGVWAPGTPPWRLPEGFAKKIPAGSKILVQAHYQPTGKPEPSSFRLGLYAGKSTDRLTDWITFDKGPFVIEAEASPDFIFDYVLPRDSRLVSVAPEARFFGTRVRLLAEFPDSKVVTVFENYRWSPYYIGNWAPKSAIDLPKGTKLKAILSYSNDENCVMNEGKKPEKVFSGPRLGDEVCRMHLLLVPKQP